MKKYRCSVCGNVYDPEKRGIPKVTFLLEHLLRNFLIAGNVLDVEILKCIPFRRLIFLVRF